MKLILTPLVATLFFGNIAAKAQQEEALKKARQQTEIWLPFIDSGKYAKSWETAAPTFQQSISQTQWVQAAQQVREPLGAVQSRELQKAEYTSSLPNAPEGEYVVIEYATSFENHEQATETVILMKTNSGDWAIAGYLIR